MKLDLTPNQAEPKDESQSGEYTPILIGEGKKYKDVQTADQALIAKDEFIERLKKENQEAREEIRKRLDLEEFLKEMKTTPKNEPVSASNQGEQKPTDERDIEAIINSKLSTLQNETVKANNEAKVVAQLTAKWGQNYSNKLVEKVRSLDLSDDLVKQMAQTNPNALIKILGLEETQPTTRNHAPPQNTRTSSGTVGSQKNQAYYSNMRRTEPKKFWSTATQSEMHKMARELGDDFYK